EYVRYGGRTLVAPGLGSLITQASAAANFALLAAGVLTMSCALVVLNRSVWRRLYRVADERFSLNRELADAGGGLYGATARLNGRFGEFSRCVRLQQQREGSCPRHETSSAIDRTGRTRSTAPRAITPWPMAKSGREW